jgi:predicted nucleic acid-binding protein
MIVLDTNVISELMKPAPSTVVRAWVSSQSSTSLFTTAVNVAEILYGIERLPQGRRKRQLRELVGDVFSAFDDKVLAFDHEAARAYASLVDRRSRLGRPVEGFDAQIAAICAVHGATLATRNLKDFVDTGISAVDPWSTT